jgi:hypothetical protein
MAQTPEAPSIEISQQDRLLDLATTLCLISGIVPHWGRLDMQEKDDILHALNRTARRLSDATNVRLP